MGWQDAVAAARAEPLDDAALAAAVAMWHPGAGVVATRPLLGGLASLMDVVEVAGAPADRVVLRRLLPELDHDEAAAAREHAGHDAAVAGGVPAPRVLWADHAGGQLGRPALLLDHLPGRPMIGELARPHAAAALAAAMADVHAVVPAAGSELPLLVDAPAHRDVFGGPQDVSDVVDATRLLAVVDSLATAFVADHRLVHGDLHGGNVLWDGHTVTGVVDWTGVGRGVHWYDEAYAVMDVVFAHGRDAGSQLRRALRARTGPPRPDEATWSLWYGVALARTLPSPREWVPGYRAAGLDVTGDALEQRYAREVADFLATHD